MNVSLMPRLETRLTNASLPHVCTVRVLVARGMQNYISHRCNGEFGSLCDVVRVLTVVMESAMLQKRAVCAVASRGKLYK